MSVALRELVALLETVETPVETPVTGPVSSAPKVKKVKRPTYQAAQTALMDYLEKQGWTLSRGLAVPHATSPDNERRLWFTAGNNVKNFKGARSLHDDVRDFTPDQFMAKAEKLMSYAATSPDW